MFSSEDDPSLNWQPPKRPEWVQRVVEEGACMDIRGVVPLDEQSLLQAAVQSTGLSDFGDPEWLTAFRVFIDALEKEANLNLMGRLRIRQEMLLFLKTRLQVEDTYKRHPEIDDEVIRQPILVTGQGRSGTSMLQNVLAANPDYGTLLHWEMLLPCPPPEKATYHTDPRIEQADRWITQWNRVVPTLESMHEFHARMPFECTVVMSIPFQSDAWLAGLVQVPSFHGYIAQSDPTLPLLFLKRVLKLLQWKNPRNHWVLKDVSLLRNLPAVFKVFPDVCVVWAHRDPVRSTASFINMLGTMQWAQSDTPLQAGSLDMMRDPMLSASLFNSVIDLIESGAIPAGQLYNVHYKDLVSDTMGTLESIHRFFGIPLSDAGRAGMAKYLADNPRDSRPAHRYPAVKGQALDRAREVYSRYQNYFGIPSE
ncbi:MAG: hypothetical protein JWQ90_4790 [Hydrocarboniphaga sp.]|uniref:sulfotransferase family protein n=1 Tax=Hydrocarboniphaga sp. TaxID=2033016 RepID=UPI0026287E1B|nr:sulfotransferase [Hydrocarboniphaga sp.]MDB5972340.1 hypothetical protein [Hydrocarboniphaga sp.]